MSNASNIFSDTIFLLVDATIPSKRLQIHKNIITKQQGKAVLLSEHPLKDVHQFLSKMVILVDSYITEKTLKELLKLPSLTEYNVLTVEYISDCVKNKSKLPYTNYIWGANKLQNISALSADPPIKRKHDSISGATNKETKEIKLETKIPETILNSLTPIISTVLKPFKTSLIMPDSLQPMSDTTHSPHSEHKTNNQILEELILHAKEENKQDPSSDADILPPPIKQYNNEEDLKGTLLEGIKGFEKIKVENSIVVPLHDNARDYSNEKYWDKQKSTFLVDKVDTMNNKNEHITKELDRLLHIYEADNDRGRFLGYRRAINLIKVHPEEINDSKQLQNVKGIGSKIRDKICEILRTGTLKRAVFLEHDEKIQTVTLFTKIYGVGPQLANKFYQCGCRTIEDIRKHPELLNPSQMIGLKYFEELNEKIAASEVKEITERVKAVCSKLCDVHLFKLECCGSYRRGRAFCGDADIIITRSDDSSLSEFLDSILANLDKENFITDHLSGNHQSHHGSVSFMGICQLNSLAKHRRIDIKIYPKEQYGFAILYFTGSANFNRSMRLFANKKGFSLGDYGLMPALRVNNERVWTGESIACMTEEDVFKALHLDYKTPQERDI